MEKNHPLEKSSTATSPTVLEGLPFTPSLLGKAAFKRGSYKPGDQLPAKSMEVRDVVIDKTHLNSYKDVCGFGKTDLIPATYLHMLAFPLFLKIVTKQAFPLKALGQVHLGNEITVLETFNGDQPITLRASVGHGKLTGKGLEWYVESTASVDNQVIWTSTSTYLHRCKTGMKRGKPVKAVPQGECQVWDIPADIGRRYAWISNDYNPIHLANTTAKLFGFRQAIAHGMWSKARCLAELQPELPEKGYSINVSFFRPIFLPSSVKFYHQNNENDHTFSLFNKSGGQAYLIGTVSGKE